MAAIVRITNLTKQYGNLTAVDHVSFEIKESEIVSLLGPNGAGKTTIIQMLLTLVSPTSGDIEIFGTEEKSTTILLQKEIWRKKEEQEFRGQCFHGKDN